MVNPSSKPTTAHCSHDVTPEGVHILRYHDSTRESVDEFYAHMEAIYRETTLEQRIYILVKSDASTAPSMNYMMQGNKAMQERVPKRAASTSAILFSSPFIVRLLDTVLSIMTRNTSDRLRFFEQKKEADALAWLISEMQRDRA